MLAHYYYCLHFAYHLKGEAKHIVGRPLSTPRQRPIAPPRTPGTAEEGMLISSGIMRSAASVRARGVRASGRGRAKLERRAALQDQGGALERGYSGSIKAGAPESPVPNPSGSGARIYEMS